MSQRHDYDDERVVEFPKKGSDGNGGLFTEWRRFLVDSVERHENAIRDLTNELREAKDASAKRREGDLAEIRRELDSQRTKITWAYAFAAGIAAAAGLIIKILWK